MLTSYLLVRIATLLTEERDYNQPHYGSGKLKQQITKVYLSLSDIFKNKEVVDEKVTGSYKLRIYCNTH